MTYINLALFNGHYALRSHRCLYIIQVHLKITRHRHLSALNEIITLFMTK
jgi:hypothetical protein